MKIRFLGFASALLSLTAVALPGCHGADDGMSQGQRDKAERLSTIATKSGGDWEKVPETDRAYILQNFTSGDEKGARMLLLAKAGKLRAMPGSPPGGPARR